MMRRFDKETFALFEAYDLMEEYKELCKYPAKELVKVLEELKTTDNIAVDGLCKLVLTRAIKTVIGQEIRHKKSAPPHHIERH